MGLSSGQTSSQQEKAGGKSMRSSIRPAGLFTGLMVGALSLMGSAQAGEPEVEASSVSVPMLASLDDGLALELAADASSDVDMSTDENGLMSLGQYAPPPPRRYYGPSYRYYRPAWRLRVLPPPLFAPGWFGLYFFGNPPPPPPTQYAPAPAPEAPVARTQDFRHVGEYSVSLMAGMHDTAYAITGQAVADPGARVALRYRNAPSLGAELALGMYGSNLRFDDRGTDQRTDMPIQLSALIYAFPRSPIQPYLVLGATGNMRTYKFMYENGTLGDSYTEVRAGVHGGLGVDLNVGDRVSFSLETRRVIYTMVDRSVAGQTVPTDRQITGGLNLYF